MIHTLQVKEISKNICTNPRSSQTTYILAEEQGSLLSSAFYKGKIKPNKTKNDQTLSKSSHWNERLQKSKYANHFKAHL